jgi:hypothetical protein
LLIQFLLVIIPFVIAGVFFHVPRHDTIAYRFAVEVFLGLGLVLLAAGLAAMVLSLLLSLKVYHGEIGFLLAVLTLIPCLGLFVLLVVNRRAIFVLRQHGHKVGLLGARLSEFKDSSTFDPASPHPDPLPKGEGEA